MLRNCELLQRGVQHAIDPGNNISWTKRFHEVRIGSTFFCNSAIFYLTTRSHQPDKNILESWVGLDDIEHLQSIHDAGLDSIVGQTNSLRTSLTATFDGMMSIYTKK